MAPRRLLFFTSIPGSLARSTHIANKIIMFFELKSRVELTSCRCLTLFGNSVEHECNAAITLNGRSLKLYSDYVPYFRFTKMILQRSPKLLPHFRLLWVAKSTTHSHAYEFRNMCLVHRNQCTLNVRAHNCFKSSAINTHFYLFEWQVSLYFHWKHIYCAHDHDIQYSVYNKFLADNFPPLNARITNWTRSAFLWTPSRTHSFIYRHSSTQSICSSLIRRMEETKRD